MLTSNLLIDPRDSQRLGPHWKEYKYYRENPWVDLVDNAKMRPDVIIDPEK
jgi:hypothetical protein